MHHLIAHLRIIPLLLCAGCSVVSAETPPAAQSSGEHAPQKIDSQHLPNAYRLHEKVISGGLPAGEAAFAELRDLGVKTIISVDGAQPDIELARRYGLRYVHLPHSYDGIPEERVEALTKAVRDLPGPIYIHCHHGKHRSPAAATVACIGAGLLSPDDGLAVLRTAGTSPNYRGLYEAVAAAHRWDDAALDALQIEFPEHVDVPPMADAMVAIEHTHDHLKQIEQAGWQAPPDHPALEPAHEALLLREHFTELLRTEEVRQQPQLFQDLLRDSETAASEIETALKARPDPQQPVPDAVTQAFLSVTNNCKACHQQFRDVPLSEK